MNGDKKVGLSLSGGGYRAAAFHLGTLRKLNQLNVLEKIDILSTISGGSITGACFCLTKNDFATFDERMAAALSEKSVIKYVLTSPRSLCAWALVLLLLASIVYFPFTHFAWLSVIVLAAVITLILLFQYKLFPVSAIIEQAYDEFFYQEAKLSSLCEKPLLVIGSTNIQTCRQFSFSRSKMEDSMYTYAMVPVKFKQADFPVARAVMASSCVPFAFAPIGIAKEFYVDPALADTINPQLVDGGVYDNQGIHRLTQKGYYECGIIITSDAGNVVPFTKSCNNVFVLLIRTMDVLMRRIKNFQMMQNIYANTTTVNKEIAYFSLEWDIENCISGFINNLAGDKVTAAVIEAHKIPEEWLKDAKEVEAHRREIQNLLEQNVNYTSIVDAALTPAELAIARAVGTNLTKLTVKEVSVLSRHAANMTELQLKLYCPSLFSLKKNEIGI